MFSTKTKKPDVQTNGKSAAHLSAKIDDLQKTIEREAANGMSAPAAVVPAMTPVAGANVIGKGTVIEGSVTAEGDLHIEGTVHGDVTTKTKLVVAASAVVEGNILAQHAEIAGKVKGTVETLGLLIINSSGVIVGDVITKNLNVESGSSFDGRLQVGSSGYSVDAAPKKEVVESSVFDMDMPKSK